MVTEFELNKMGYTKDGKKIADAPEITKTEERENRLQKNCQDYLDDKNIYWVHLENARRNRPGIPDLLICLDGKAVYVELKTLTKIKPDQLIERAKILNSGGVFEIITTLRDFKKLINTLRGK